MSAFMLQQIRKKASGLIESHLLKAGRVLEVRKWESSAIVEIDLHLPSAAMEEWKEVPYMKCKVAEFTYRDYTPSGWDAETRTCTLYVDAGHDGPGSRWARHLIKDENIGYLGISSTRHAPVQASNVVCLGDESSMGHLLAIQQLAHPDVAVSGAIIMGNEKNRSLFNECFRSPIQAIDRNAGRDHDILAAWLSQRSYNPANTAFCLAGNSTTVVQLRKWLKQSGYSSCPIKAQGFWSA